MRACGCDRAPDRDCPGGSRQRQLGERAGTAEPAAGGTAGSGATGGAASTGAAGDPARPGEEGGAGPVGPVDAVDPDHARGDPGARSGEEGSAVDGAHVLAGRREAVVVDEALDAHDGRRVAGRLEAL